MANRIVRSLNWRRWSAPLSAIVDVTEAAVAEIHAWAENEPSVTVEAALPQLVMHFDSTQDFAAGLPAYELPTLQSVRIAVTAYGPPPKDDLTRYGVSFRLQKADPSLSVEITGTDRVRVEGLAKRLTESLDHARSGPLLRSEDMAALLFGVLVWFFVAVALRLNTASILIPIAALLLAMVVGTWLLPGLEVLAPGQTSRYHRFRALGVAVVVGVIASLVYAGLEKFIVHG